VSQPKCEKNPECCKRWVIFSRLENRADALQVIKEAEWFFLYFGGFLGADFVLNMASIGANIPSARFALLLNTIIYLAGGYLLLRTTSRALALTLS
jgi:hypothetical protein